MRAQNSQHLRWIGVVTSALVAAAVIGCNGSSRLNSSPVAIGSEPADARRGEYLVAAAGCVGCHTDKEHGGARLAGGKAIETPFGAYYSRNITPDVSTGIGGWSDADFFGALRRGLSPTGAHYFAAFPFASFTGMTDADIRDIKAYLFTQSAQTQPNRPHDVAFPFDIRLTMVAWRALYFREGPLKLDPARGAEWNRGAYLVEAVAHCEECHTPRTWLGGLDESRQFGGGTLFGRGAKHVPNITPDLQDGIGKWSIDDIVFLLKTGVAPNGDAVEAPMSDVVEDLSHLTEADRRSIAIYLKSLPPLRGKGG